MIPIAKGTAPKKPKKPRKKQVGRLDLKKTKPLLKAFLSNEILPFVSGFLEPSRARNEGRCGWCGSLFREGDFVIATRAYFLHERCLAKAAAALAMRAAAEASVEPHYKHVTCKDPIDYVIAANADRRHLTHEQKAMAAGRAQDLREQAREEAKTRQKEAGEHGTKGGRGNKAETLQEHVPEGFPAPQSRDEIGAKFGVSGKTVDAAVKILQQGVPDLIEAVDKGQITVSAAAILTELPGMVQDEVVALPKKEREKIVRKQRDAKRARQTPSRARNKGACGGRGRRFREGACTVHQGTEDDAAWYSAGANREHGTPSSLSDKRSCVLEILRRPSIAKERSNGVIAKQVGCDVSWVRKVRSDPVQHGSESHVGQRSGLDGKTRPATSADAQKQLESVAEAVLANPAATVRELAATTGAGKSTVAKIKKAATANPDAPASELAKRKGSAPKAEEKAPFPSTWQWLEERLWAYPNASSCIPDSNPTIQIANPLKAKRPPLAKVWASSRTQTTSP